MQALRAAGRTTARYLGGTHSRPARAVASRAFQCAAMATQSPTAQAGWLRPCLNHFGMWHRQRILVPAAGGGLACQRRTLRAIHKNTTPEITIDELTALMDSGEDMVIIDVREADEVSQGVIPGAQHMPLGEVSTAVSMEPGDFEERYGFPMPKRSQNIVLYCRAGVRSEQAAHVFLHAGFKNTKNYRGSWLEWSHVKK